MAHLPSFWGCATEGALPAPHAGALDALHFVESRDHRYEIREVVGRIGMLDDRIAFGSIADFIVIDTTYYVADGLTPRIVQLDRALNPVRISGRRGQGPGEYEFPSQLTSADRGIIVLDVGNARVSHLGAEGEYRSSLRVPGNASAIAHHPTLGNLIVSGAFADHYLAVVTEDESRPFAVIPDGFKPESEPFPQIPAHLVAVSADGAVHVLDSTHFALVSYTSDGELTSVRLFPEPARTRRLERRARLVEDLGGRSRVLAAGIARSLRPLADGRMFIRVGIGDTAGYVLDIDDLEAIPVVMSPSYWGNVQRPSGIAFDGMDRAVIGNRDAELIVANVVLVEVGGAEDR